MQQLQKDYAGKDVKLFLFPCNQFLFSNQTQTQVESFAEKYLNLTSGNIKLFANLAVINRVIQAVAISAYHQAKVAAANNGVYDYLKSVVKGSVVELQ